MLEPKWPWLRCSVARPKLPTRLYIPDWNTDAVMAPGRAIAVVPPRLPIYTIQPGRPTRLRLGGRSPAPDPNPWPPRVWSSPPPPARLRIRGAQSPSSGQGRRIPDDHCQGRVLARTEGIFPGAAWTKSSRRITVRHECEGGRATQKSPGRSGLGAHDRTSLARPGGTNDSSYPPRAQYPVSLAAPRFLSTIPRRRNAGRARPHVVHAMSRARASL